MAVAIVLHAFYDYDREIEEQKSRAFLLAGVVKGLIETPVVGNDPLFWDHLLRYFSSTDEVEYVDIVSEDRIIRSTSDINLIGVESDRKEIEKAFLSRKPAYEFLTLNKKRILSCIYPLKKSFQYGEKGESLEAVIDIGLNWQPVRERIFSRFKTEVFVGSVFCLFYIILFFLFHKMYTGLQTAYKDLKKTQTQLVQSEKMVAIGRWQQRSATILETR